MLCPSVVPCGLGTMNQSPCTSASSSECSSRCWWGWTAMCSALHVTHPWGQGKLGPFLPALLEWQNSIQMENAVPSSMPLLRQPMMKLLTPLCQVKETHLGKRLSCKLGGNDQLCSSIAQNGLWEWMRSHYIEPHEITFLNISVVQ